jgi:hypothetical protein
MSFAASWEEGIPTQVMKSDYNGLHAIYVQLEDSVPKGSCDSGDGLVVLDENESSEVAIRLALTAFASGKKFRCYVSGQCSRITGGATTYPVCSYYPSITN